VDLFGVNSIGDSLDVFSFCQVGAFGQNLPGKFANFCLLVLEDLFWKTCFFFVTFLCLFMEDLKAIFKAFWFWKTWFFCEFFLGSHF